jgi:hypothetical protein
MLTIPSGDAARAAWSALPPGIRADVVERAKRYEGYPDPAVAAIAVGRFRAGVDLQWYRVAAAFIGMAVAGGAAVAYLGDPSGRYLLGAVSAGGTGLILAGAAMHWPDRYRIDRAEAANLQVFLDSPDAAVAADPPSSPRQMWRRMAAGVAMLALGIPAAAYLQIHLMYLDFDPDALGRHAAYWAGIGLLANGSVFVAQRLDPRRNRARTVSVGEDGVRFNRHRLVPWADVLGVELRGPTESDPDRKNEMVWSLRGRPDVVVPLNTSKQPPEELILAARSQMGAAAR